MYGFCDGAECHAYGSRFAGCGGGDGVGTKLFHKGEFNMNFDQITDLTVHGRFRIPFPDTSYAKGERRDPPTPTRNCANAAGEFVDRRSLRCFVTAHVVASIENLCASELAAHINSAAESVMGSEVLLKHNHPAAVGSMVSVIACVKTIVDRSVTFDVEATVGDVVIADGQLRLVIVARDRFAPRPIQSIVERAFSDILSMGDAAPVTPDVRARADVQKRGVQNDVQKRDVQERGTARLGGAAGVALAAAV
jgi:predicted thioesterase